MRVTSRALALGSFLWCLVYGAWTAVTPVRYLRGPERVVVEVPFSEVSRHGVWVLVVPLAISGYAAWASWDQQTRHTGFLFVAAIVLLLFAVASAFSIGLGYVPAVLALWGAASMSLAEKFNRNSKHIEPCVTGSHGVRGAHGGRLAPSTPCTLLRSTIQWQSVGNRIQSDITVPTQTWTRLRP